MSILFKGSAVAIITPMKDDKPDFESMKRLIEWQISEGADAIVAAGTTGEASTLGDEEHISIVKFVVDTVNKRVPVIGGAGSNDTAHAIMMSKRLEDIGIDGILLVTPYYNKCTQKGLIAHYIKIADAVNKPIIIYSVPSRTGVNINPETVAVLAKHKNIVGIKEASGNISQVVEIARHLSDDFCMYSGNDDMIIPLMSVGGAGVISTIANICPKDTHDMVMKYLDGDVKAAAKLQIDMKPIIDAVFIEVNPIPIKTAASLMGFCTSEMRLPLCQMEDKNLEVLKKEMKAYGLI